MRFDRPSRLGSSGVDVLCGGSSIDPEDRRLLQRIYPKLFDACLQQLVGSRVSGWRSGIGEAKVKTSYQVKQTANIITALCRLDLGLNGNFRVDSWVENIQRGSRFDVGVGTWMDTHLIDASCNVLSFDDEDQRVQTGRLNYLPIRPSARPGESGSEYIRFSRPFKNVPKVTTFISKIDTNKGVYLRLNVSASDIDRNGFRLTIRTWAGQNPFPPLPRLCRRCVLMVFTLTYCKTPPSTTLQRVGSHTKPTIGRSSPGCSTTNLTRT